MASIMDVILPFVTGTAFSYQLRRVGNILRWRHEDRPLQLWSHDHAFFCWLGGQTQTLGYLYTCTWILKP